MSSNDPKIHSDAQSLPGARQEIQVTPDDSMHQRSQVKTAIDRLGLEEIVQIAHKVGLEYVHLKQEAERLELLRPVIRARIAMRLDSGDLSEARLKRMTDSDPEYVDFIERYSRVKSDSEKARMRYESYRNLFEARRSLLSYQKAEMKII